MWQIVRDLVAGGVTVVLTTQYLEEADQLADRIAVLIIARFRTMAISRASVLTGHVLGSMIQTMLSMAVVIGVAQLIGFRPTAGLLEWIAAFGVLALITLALTWPSVALGMVTRSVESASNPHAPAAPAVPR